MVMYRIDKPDFFLRLIDKLNLKPASDEDLLRANILDTTINLVLDISDLLGKIDAKPTSLDLSGSGFVTGFEVPQGKRWTVWLAFGGETTGSSRISILPKGQGSTYPLTTAGTGEKFWTGKLTMGEGWKIGMQATGDLNDTAIPFRIVIQEFDAF